MYGCCNLTDAICCADEVHCCPSGYTCSENEGQCYVRFGQHSQTVPANRKYKATHIGELIAKQTKDHECGTDAECQKNYSCCSVDEQGNYGCYKGKNAMCCADGKSWCIRSCPILGYKPLLQWFQVIMYSYLLAQDNWGDSVKAQNR